MRQADLEKISLQAFAALCSGSDNTLSGLLTRKEQIMVGRRILIANAIIAGKTRMEIQDIFHISPNTFTHVRRWLENECHKYEAPQATTAHARPTSTSRVLPFSYEDMKRRYPAHFLLFSLIEHYFKKTPT